MERNIAGKKKKKGKETIRKGKMRETERKKNNIRLAVHEKDF